MKAICFIRSAVTILFTAMIFCASGQDFDPAEKFRQLVKSGEISRLCRERSTLNMPSATAGGKVWWESVECDNWKLQFNKISGQWRILDPDGRRLAWGFSCAQLKKFLLDRPTSFFANYFDRGECFYRYPGSKEATVVLIHGWSVRAASLAPYAQMLQSENFTVLNYDYPTSEKNIAAHAETFLRKFREEKISGPVYFLTHSMGGIILRHAMAKMDENELKNIAAVVMLGPPNRGSFWAIPGKVLLKENHSVTDLIPYSEALLPDLPAPAPPLGIIAGSYDIVVPVEYTGLTPQIQSVTVPYSHAGLRNPEKTGQKVLDFFRNQRF